MLANSPSFRMVQKYPEYRTLTPDHPCVTNTYPAYIDKYDRRVKIGSYSIPQKAKISNNIVPLPSDVVLEPPKENVEKIAIPPFTVESSTSIIGNANNKLVASIIESQVERKVRFTGDELLRLDLSQYRDIVEDLFPDEEISVLAGPGGVGKSGLYLHCCLQIVLGEDVFIGKKVNSKHNSALIIATEDNEKRLSSRIKKMHKKISPEGRSIKNLVIITSGADLLKTVREELEKQSFDLVVVDALTDILDSDQNSPTDVRRFYNDFETFIREFHTSFLFVTHVNKSSNKNGRFRILGSTAIVDRARSVLMMDKDLKTGIRTLIIEKSNNISDEKLGKPIKLRFDPDTLTFSLAGEYSVNKELDSETSLAVDICKAQQAAQSNKSVSQTNRNKKRPGRHLNVDNVFEAYRLYSEEGKTYEEIGKIYKKNKATIWRWINVIYPSRYGNVLPLQANK